MINNANQDIRTNYQALDIFKPNAANQLARSVSYDFVITPAILENYLAKHPTITEIDVGDLIACDSEGNDAAWSSPVKAPVSIYIGGNTSLSDTYCFNFGGRLLTDILDCSDYQVDGDWDSTVTEDMVNVYSAHPYRLKELVAGINFWSSYGTMVSIAGGYANNSGVTKIGVYSTEGTPEIYDLGEADFIQIVCKRFYSGTPFSISPSKAHIMTGYRAAVVVADWMFGNTAVTSGYAIMASDISKPGIFQQILESLRYGSEPLLFVGYTQATAYYHMCHHETNEIRFSNSDEGKLICVNNEGDITWKLLSGVGNSRAVIVDTDTSGVIPYVDPGNIPHKYIVGGANNLDSLSIVRPNTGFITPQQDMGRIHPGGAAASPTWYNAYPGFSFENGVVTTVDWYFWYAISDFDDADDTTLVWRKNSRLELQIDVGMLREGLVYEIDCHVIALPSGPLTSAGNPEYPDYSVGNPPLIYGKQATPVTMYDTDDVLDCISLDLKPCISFRGHTGGSADICLWGLPDRVLSSVDNNVYPAFYPAPEPNFGATNVLNAGIQLKDLARAKVLFTYLGGKVYIMSY